MLSGFKTRKPWAAALVSAVPGPIAGMLYLSRGWLALTYLGALLVLVASFFAAAHFQLTHFDPRNGITISSWLLQIIGAFHAYVIAKHRKAKEPNKWYSRWYNIIMLCFVMPMAAAFVFRLNFYEPFRAGSPSMEPTISADDYFLVKKRAYANALPKRGDIVMFKVLLSQGVVEYVKRIVGLPGDKIQIKQGTIYINDVPLPRRELPDMGDDKVRFVETLPEGREITLQEDKDTVANANPNNYLPEEEKIMFYNVPNGQYFVIGDYLGRSSDSRNGLGFVDRRFIVGKAIAVIWNDKTFRFSWKPLE